MRELLVTTFLTLDGVMQAPGGPEEDDSGGFSHGGWSVNYWDDLMGQVMGDIMAKPFDLLLGRRTYDIFAGYWPSAPPEAGGAPLNAATKYVASRGRPNLTWEKSVHLAGDAGPAVSALKQTDGPGLQVHGSGDLIQTLLRENLVDVFTCGSSRFSSGRASGCSPPARFPRASSSSTARSPRPAS